MTTPEIARHLALAAAQFPFLGDLNEQALLNVVRWELGHEGILDGFQPYAGHYAKAVGPRTILHVISGNTPHAGLQSLIRGLLLKAHNLCKIPSEGLPEIAQFRDALPDALAEKITIASELPPDWIGRADAVIVFGSDATIAHFRALSSGSGAPHAANPKRFIAHGHKVSLGVIFDDPDFSSVDHAGRDVSLFDQQGCLSPHGFYVNESGSVTAQAYAERLAVAMESFNQHTPRSPVSTSEAAAIQKFRQTHEFRAANDPRVRVWKSEDSTDWTVILDPEPEFMPSCLNRVIFVKPFPSNLEQALSSVRFFLSTIAIWPATPENALRVSETGASRICAVGNMQLPLFSWHQDGGQNLAPLVHWIDFEP